MLSFRCAGGQLFQPRPVAGAPGFLGSCRCLPGAEGAEEEGMTAMLPCTWPQGAAHWALGPLLPSLQISVAALTLGPATDTLTAPTLCVQNAHWGMCREQAIHV